MKIRDLGLTLLILPILLWGCASEPEVVEVEVTRLVDQEVPVTVQVTTIAEVPVTVEVPVESSVEVTRVVEVVVTATPGITETAVVTDTVETPTVVATATVAQEGSNYTIATGDTLSSIATKTGVTVTAIMTANNLTNENVISAGQELFVPGWDGTLLTPPTLAPTATGAAVPTAVPPQPAAQGGNLFPNPSFEGDWYFHIYNELQIPNGWQVATDEGENTLQPGSGGLFNRPEIRVVPHTDLPPSEQSTFILEGNKTLKAFKGGAPTSFSLFTDVALQPGTYRITVRFFADTVVAYDGGQKIYADDPLAAEVRIIQNNGGTNWQGTQSGQVNTVTYDFTVTAASTVRLGASFRNRFIMGNNGWFIDDWSLVKLN